MLKLYNVRMKQSNMRKNKETIKCDKKTITCDVRTALCEDETVKCDVLVTQYCKLPTSEYRAKKKRYDKITHRFYYN